MSGFTTQRRLISKKVRKIGENRGKSGSLNVLRASVRPLWRAADSGAEDPKLAARPFEFVPRNLRFWFRWISGG